jgi:hypothetical protein
MLRLFRRRSKGGKHLLGAAVTGIPSLVSPVVVAHPGHAAVPFVPTPLPPDLPSVVDPIPVLVLSPAQAPGARVELGFRDGSTASLAPGSEQAKALTDLASVLTQRD